MAKDCSFGIITDGSPPSLLCIGLSGSGETGLSFSAAVPCPTPLVLPAVSEEPTNGLIGDVGEEFKDTTDGGDIKEAGAKTVIVRSSDVKFEA